ncbi:MHYT domain-containing protein [Cohnella kolymensis]|uniref:MHYT domain-containing protein n=1 Tax=Cohnella kolymensis TaxID=1590652 RepID=UPI000698143E|nr:MHYT domain-containing protein [Cohnella kolymensis]
MHHEFGQYHMGLVLLSILVSIVSAYTAFDLVDRLLSSAQRRLRSIILASLVIGIGLWSMHFIGMLAYRLPFTVTYHLMLLLLSLLLTISAAFAALMLIVRPRVKVPHFIFGGLFIASAVVSAHYTGMQSMHTPIQINYSPVFVVLSVFIALMLSAASLYIPFKYRTKRLEGIPSAIKAAGSLVMGILVPAMHYTAMAGTYFNGEIVSHPAGELKVIDSSNLAQMVGGGTLFILAAILTALFMDRQRVLRTAAFNERRYMSLFEHSPDMVICYDPADNRILSANPAAYLVTGYSAEEMAKMTWREIICDDQEMSRVKSQYEQENRAANIHKIECYIRHKQGNRVVLSSTMFPLTVEDKLFIYAIARDITDQKNAETALIETKETAEKANRVKGDFLAMMSHEIRTPLNGILGINQLMAETELDTNQRELLLIQEKSGQALLRVINDILDFSKMEAGKVMLENEIFHLRCCMEESINLFTVTAVHKGIQLQSDIDERIPEFLAGDPIRLRQIFVNLVGNAVKFTDTGSVSLEAKLLHAGQDTAEIEFTVTDTGIGIHPSQFHLLFLPFSQLSSSTGRSKLEGTGLGLSICRELVSAMGGDIWIEEGRKKGAAFGFRIPFTTAVVEQAVSDCRIGSNSSRTG